MADISVDISTPQLDGVIKRLGQDARAGLHADIAGRLQTVVDNYLADYSISHHATAARLAARPTGNLEGAKVTASSDDDGATVTVAAKGIRRALGPLTIRPKARQSLTIPVAALAYGRTVADLKARGVALFRPKGKNYIATTEGKGKNAKVVPLYILAKRAVLKHEPALLPRGETLAANALAAARDYIMEGVA